MIRRLPVERDHVDRAGLTRTLREWCELTHEDAADGETAGTIRAISVRHRGTRIPVMTRAVGRDAKVSDLAETIASRIEADAEMHRNAGPQTYSVEAYFGADTTPREYWGCVVESETDDAGGGGEATPRGTIKLAHELARVGLREGTRLTRTNLQFFERALDHASRAADRDAARIATLETRIDEMRAKVEDAEDRRVDRELRQKADERRAQMLEDLFLTAKNWLPIIANKVLGTEFPEPVQKHPVFEQFRLLYEELSTDPQVLGKLAEALTDKPRAMHQLAALMTAIEDARDVAKARAEIAAKAEADAARALTAGSSGET